MQQRFAFALLMRMTKFPAGNSSLAGALHGTVQAADAPEVKRRDVLLRLKKYIKGVLPLHLLSQSMSIVSDPPTRDWSRRP